MTFLFLPEEVNLIKIINYFFGFIYLRLLIDNILEICFSTKSLKTKIKEIFLIIKNVMYNVLVISALNILSMVICGIIKFEKNLSAMEKT